MRNATCPDMQRVWTFFYNKPRSLVRCLVLTAHICSQGAKATHVRASPQVDPIHGTMHTQPAKLRSTNASGSSPFLKVLDRKARIPTSASCTEQDHEDACDPCRPTSMHQVVNVGVKNINGFSIDSTPKVAVWPQGSSIALKVEYPDSTDTHDIFHV